jgi:hypothetical protein
MKRILKINEYNHYNNGLKTPLTDDELMTMSDLSYKLTGIDNVVMWVGPNPHSAQKQIKISNIANIIETDDCFTITIPELTIIGYVNKSFITDDIMNQILEFIKLNLDAIIKYSSKFGEPTKEFFDTLIPIKKYNHNNLTTNNDSLLEMANLNTNITGIQNIIIWVGANPPSQGKRIKVSNIANNWSQSDCFTITIPDLKIMGNVNKSLITSKIMKQIYKFIDLNIDIICLYEDKTLSTTDFFEKILPVLE